MARKKPPKEQPPADVPRKGFFRRFWTLINENPTPSSAAVFVVVAIAVAMFANSMAFSLLWTGLSVLILATMAITAVAGAIDTFSLKRLWIIVLSVAAMTASGLWAWGNFTAVRQHTMKRVEGFVQSVLDAAGRSDEAALKKCVDPELVGDFLRVADDLKKVKQVKSIKVTGSAFRCFLTLQDDRRYAMNIVQTDAGYKVSNFAQIASQKKPEKTK